MGIFSRMSNMIKAKVNNTLDEMENPVELLDQKLRDMDEQFNKAKLSSAQILGNVHEIEKKLDAAKKESADYDQKVKLALGKELEVRITELDFRNNKVVASRRVIEEEEYNKNKKVVWDSLIEGEKRTGVVKKLVKFGAFVDIGGVEGLIHLSDLSWERVNKPEDVVREGDKVEVFIGNVDKKNERLSLILKDVAKEPWTVHSNDIKEGDILEGKVVRLTSFGAFVELFNGIEGLVHITEITDENIAKASDVLEVNQKVKVKVLSINREDKKIALSIKEAVETNKEYLNYVDNDDEAGTSLGELLKGLNLN